MQVFNREEILRFLFTVEEQEFNNILLWLYVVLVINKIVCIRC